MTSGPSYFIETSSLLLVGLSSLLAVAAVVLVVRSLAPRRGWTRDATAALTWSSSVAVAAVLSLVWIAALGAPVNAGDDGSYSPLPDDGSYPPPPDDGSWTMAWPEDEPLSVGISTLVWLPCVMALLWSVLHSLRSGAGHHAPLLDVPVGLAIPALWLVSAPLQVTVFAIGVLGALSWVGLVVWLVGQGLVATGRSWVGDVAVWVGIALVAADAWPGYLGLVSPLVVAALVLFQQRRRADGVRVS